MFSSRQHIKKYKLLIASLLLGIFLLSNYGVNFIKHYHEKYDYFNIQSEREYHKDCLICSFQNLLYEPLSQNYFDLEQVFQDIYKSINLFYCDFSLLEYSSYVFQRGPPVFFV